MIKIVLFSFITILLLFLYLTLKVAKMSNEWSSKDERK